jgi:hypothetical protein
LIVRIRFMGTRAAIGAASLVVTLLAGSSGPARAQEEASPGDAEFNEALRAYKQEQYDVACPRFLRSYELDPTQIGVLHALAECYAKAGKVASAVARFRAYSQAVAALPADAKPRHRQRIERSEAQIAALAPDVPAVTILVRGPGAPKARVLLDDKELREPSLREPQPVDPGAHRVSVTSADGVTAERAFTIALGEKTSIELEVQAKSAVPAASPRPDSGMSGRRVGAITALGVGAAGFIVMGITGGVVLGNKTTVHNTCPADASGARGVCRTEADLNHANAMFTLGTISTASLGVGVAATALGTVLLLTEPKRTKSAGGPSWVALGPMRIDREAVLIGATGAF